MGGNSSNLSEYFSSSSVTASHSKTDNNNLPSWVKKEREQEGTESQRGNDEHDDDIPPSHNEPPPGTGFVKAAILASGSGSGSASAVGSGIIGSGSKPMSKAMAGKGVNAVTETDDNEATKAPTTTKNIIMQPSDEKGAITGSSPYVPASFPPRVMREEASSSSVVRSVSSEKSDQSSVNQLRSGLHSHNGYNGEEGAYIQQHNNNTAESSPTIVKQRPPYASYTSGRSLIFTLPYKSPPTSPYFPPTPSNTP